MFESGGASTGDLEGLPSALSGLERAVDDTERVDQLDLLERVKAACAATQARVAVELAESQREIAEQWREDARAVAEAGDFEAWRRARAMARAASCPEADDATQPPPTEPVGAAAVGVERRPVWPRRSRWHGGSRRTPGAGSCGWPMR